MNPHLLDSPHEYPTHGKNYSLWRLLKRGFKNHSTWERAALQPSSDDVNPPITSGIRVGTAAAGSTRGFGVAEFEEGGRLMREMFNNLKTNSAGDVAVEASVCARVKALTTRIHLYP